MEDMKPNPNRFEKEKQQEEVLSAKKKVEPVAKGKIRKKSEVDKIKNVFISEDASNIKEYVLMDVLVPAIKKAISDIIVNGIDMVLYGSTGHSSSRRRTSERVSYDQKYRRDRDRGTSARTAYNYDDILFQTRGEAEDVLDRMFEMVEDYGMVSLADMYDMAELSCPFTHNKYGWKGGLRGSEVVRVRDGYIIKLPSVKPLN